MGAPIPAEEEARLAILREYRILDTAAEKAFDDITRLAAEVCAAPVALLSFVERERVWIKSNVGLGVKETRRDVSICSYAILHDDLFVVPDARADERFSRHAMVTGGPQVRFYAGMPLMAPEGLAVGTLCVIDVVPRQLTREQSNKLRALAQTVMMLLEVRRSRG